jgi:hypothetical protein
MINKRRKRQEIERLLPWHAAGTLSRREAASSSEHLLAIPNSRGAMTSLGGRQTRLELTSGSFPSEHTLALARACAA